MAKADKVTRIMIMYEAMRRGKEIHKKAFCMEHGISERTFERDIAKIRTFLSENYSGQEAEYIRSRNRYQMPGSCENGELSFSELALILKILKGGQALEKNEFEGLTRSLQSVMEKRKKEAARKLIQQEISQYEEKEGQEAFLKLFGDLLECISERNVIRLEMKGKCQEEKRIRFYPVAMECQEGEFYLLGYQKGQELSAFLMNEIESFQIAIQKYGKEIARKYSYQKGKELCKKLQEKRRGDT